MKRYGTDLEKEYKGILGRIDKRLKFLCKKTNRIWENFDGLSPEEKLFHIKLIEKTYVEGSTQLDMFDGAPKCTCEVGTPYNNLTCAIHGK